MPSSRPSSLPADVVAIDAGTASSPAVPASSVALPMLSSSGRWYALAGAGVVVAVLVGVMVGPAGPTWWRVPLELLDRLPLISIDSGVTDVQWDIIWQIRMPRVLLGGIVGAMLSLAGASYQGVFRNPLVDPYLLGVAAGAGLGATLVFTVLRSQTAGWPIDPAPAAAFAVAIVTVFVTYVVGASFGGDRTGVTLVLAGVAVSALASAVQTFLLQRNVAVVRQVYTWILGRLSTARWADIRLVLPYVLVATVVLLAHRRHLDVFRVGEEEAATLGAPVARVRLVVVIFATLGTAAVVSVSGLIGFVGILVPHVVRLVAGSSYRRLLPLSLLFGAAFLIVADIPGRVLLSPAETPIGVVTAFLGAPFFIIVLRARSTQR
jgi:cobalamin transport system permease protein